MNFINDSRATVFLKGDENVKSPAHVPLLSRNSRIFVRVCSVRVCSIEDICCCTKPGIRAEMHIEQLDCHLYRNRMCHCDAVIVDSRLMSVS